MANDLVQVFVPDRDPAINDVRLRIFEQMQNAYAEAVHREGIIGVEKRDEFSPGCVQAGVTRCAYAPVVSMDNANAWVGKLVE